MTLAEPPRHPPVAAIDCGTNSTRLLVSDAQGRTLERRMVITRMGDGVDRTGRLSPEALARTLEVLSGYGRIMESFGVGPRRAVATSAARDAANREDFFTAAEAAAGVRPELLSGVEEGRLSYRGATSGLDQEAGPYLVVDIGGGSTELVLGPDRAVSLDIGCVRLSERFLTSDPPSPDQLAAAAAEVSRQLERARSALGDATTARQMIGLAGTVSTAAMMDSGRTVYRREDVHHYQLGRDRVRALLDRLSHMDHAGRSDVPGLEPGRVDVIVGGLLVLAGALEELGFGECLVSESDILDGMVAGLLEA